ncbi:MAG TPA: queuosine precursor transporter [Bryobacteraceae bacterium]|nr:queuosine precursor transporter [Bryobacteraceae bacterium]
MRSTALLHDYPQNFKYYDLLVSAFVAVLLISNLVAPKFIAWGPFLFSGAQLLFPITYIFGDIFTEVYGYAGSRRAIWNGFLASLLLSGISAFIVALPPAPEWKNQQAYEIVLGSIPRIVAASLIAYWAGEFANSFVMARMKVVTEGKYLWMRTIGSTVVGQAVDTVLVIGIIFIGAVPVSTLLTLMISGYGGKVIYEIVATPLTYVVVNWLKRVEGVDIMDRDTDFNPFKAKLSSH